MLTLTVHSEDITSFHIYIANNIATIFLNQYGRYNKTQAECPIIGNCSTLFLVQANKRDNE